MTSSQPTSSFSTPSTSSSILCAQCNLVPSKYTCPACSFKTCSLSCSKLHKSTAPCSGIRNPASYVPMNAYAYPTMVSDYTFLSSMGRKVDDLSRENGAASTGKGKGRAGGGGGGGNGKLEALKREMGKRGMRDVTFLSEGMEKRRLNETRWQAKNQQLFMTVTLNYYPTDTDASSVEGSSFSSSTLSSPLASTLHSLPSTMIMDTLLSKHPSVSSPVSPGSYTYLLPHPTSTRTKPTFYTLFQSSPLLPPSISTVAAQPGPESISAPLANTDSPASAPTSSSDPAAPSSPSPSPTLEAFLANKAWIEWPSISILPTPLFTSLKRTFTFLDPAPPPPPASAPSSHHTSSSANNFAQAQDDDGGEGGPRKKMRVWGAKTFPEGAAVPEEGLAAEPEREEMRVKRALEEMTGIGGGVIMGEGVLSGTGGGGGGGGLGSLLGGYGSDGDSDE